MSAIVLAALVVMWAVVLVPMFLRRHERTSELAGVHRFAGAMRVLSRRRVVAPTPAHRAAVIEQALAPRVVDRRDAAAFRSATRRAERVAARRRGLGLMLGVVIVSAVLAVVLGGWFVWGQVLVDLIALAGLTRLHSSAVADRDALSAPYAPVRESARLTTAPVSPRVPVATTVTVGRPMAAPSTQPLMQPLVQPVASSEFALRPERQIVFDAVSETPIVAMPRVRKQLAPKPVKRVVFDDDAAPPPSPETLVSAEDPDTMPEGLELGQTMLDRASGE